MNEEKLIDSIIELACELDRGDIKLDELVKEAYALVKKDRAEQLTLTDVSQQRELLIAFSECVVKDVTIKGHEEVVDYFLKKHKAINCG